MKERYGLDAISYLTDSAIRWSKESERKPVLVNTDAADATVAKLLKAIERKQKETEELLSELRRRLQQSA